MLQLLPLFVVMKVPVFFILRLFLKHPVEVDVDLVNRVVRLENVELLMKVEKVDRPKSSIDDVPQAAIFKKDV